jgi:hypothetical protein
MSRKKLSLASLAGQRPRVENMFLMRCPGQVCHLTGATFSWLPRRIPEIQFFYLSVSQPVLKMQVHHIRPICTFFKYPRRHKIGSVAKS